MVFDIQRMSIHDGPGIRTTVFLKGCPLECLWCHNPEGRDGRPQLAFTPALCIGCGFCFERCPNAGHILEDGEHRLNRDACAECFACTEQCYSDALEVVGKEMSADDVLDEVQKDRPFYEESGGGMTLSGGEPLVQFDFAEALLLGARDRALHTCVETSAFVDTARLVSLVPTVDLFLVDWKETDPERHRTHTGQSCDLILENLRALDEHGAAIILRCPIIPGLNLRSDHLRGIVDVSRSLDHCQAVHIMGHHRLGEGKRARLGLEPRTDTPFPDMTREEAERVATRVRQLGGENVSTG